MELERWYYRIRAGLRTVIRRRRLEDELAAELRDHLEHETEYQVSCGVSRAEAVRRAGASLRAVQAVNAVVSCGPRGGSRISGRTLAWRCAALVAIRCSRSFASARWRSASAPTPPSSAPSTRCLYDRWPTFFAVPAGGEASYHSVRGAGPKCPPPRNGNESASRLPPSGAPRPPRTPCSPNRPLGGSDALRSRQERLLGPPRLQPMRPMIGSLIAGGQTCAPNTSPRRLTSIPSAGPATMPASP